MSAADHVAPADARAEVRVRLFAGARAAAGTGEADIPRTRAGLVSDVLDELTTRHPGLARVLPACAFLLDGVAARPRDPVGTASTLDVLPPFSGG